MEQEPHPDFEETGEEPISELGVEATPTIESLPTQLGFVETEEISQLRGEVVEVIRSGDQEKITEIISQYLALAREVVSQLPNESYGFGQIGLMVAVAAIQRDGGRTDYYIQDLEDAAECAWNMRYDDLATLIETFIESGNIPQG
jgi:hypothetical protein